MVSLLTNRNFSLTAVAAFTYPPHVFGTRVSEPRQWKSSQLRFSSQPPTPRPTAIPLSPLDENYFLSQVESTVDGVIRSNQKGGNVDILDLPFDQREAYGIATNIDKRLRSLRKNDDCPRCWLQRFHCICEECGPVVWPQQVAAADENCHNDDDDDDHEVCVMGGGGNTGKPSGSLHRIFVVLHHKEIGLKVDTAKLIFAAFPFQCELVVGGIGPKFQPSMKRMLDSTEDPSRISLLLFPDETARTLEEIVTDEENERKRLGGGDSHSNNDDSWSKHRYDLIVLDGTWAQARKFHSRYFSENHNQHKHQNLQKVQLSAAAVQSLAEASRDSGQHQLRRHEIAWRQVGTFEAVRLFLRNWAIEFPRATTGGAVEEPWERVGSYMRIANEAALRELGLPRPSNREHPND